MTSDKFTEPGLTFDDVLLVPGKSDLLPADAELDTRLTARVSLNAPFLSSPMDTVTEAPMAIAMAREGALGIIHRNLSIHDQATEVDKVKRSQSGMITDPITLHPGALLEDAHALMERYHISGVPVTEPGGRLVGILTNRDIRFCNDEATPITELMTHEELITVPEGTTLSDAEQILHRHRVEKLLVIDDDYQLKGLITVKDLTKREQFPGASFDRHGRLLVGAAVGVGEEAQQRARELVDAGVDVLVCDTAHGHSQRVIDMTAWIKDHLDIDVISGNVATAGGASDLIAAGADAVRVGVGPATICTTRVVAGVGVPQITAVSECASVCGEHGAGLIADGGIRYSGDVGKAIAAGADAVMIGSLFAGTDESPGEIILAQGERFKDYRGMGSIGAMRARSYSRDRYAQELVEDTSKLVAEGIEGRIPYRGALGHTMAQLTGGLRQSMGYCGTADIAALKSRAQFVIMTQAGLNESHPHDIVITKEAPNYQVRR
jgi:IMP dehydrogenase